jgi:23S rRNA (uracil1939-C5)-methyltransferase
MLTPGEVIAVAIEKPAAGGRMIARHEGQILLVSDTIPGERVSIRIDRVEKRLAFASTVAVLEPSPDRRGPGRDPLCGGCLYAHIAYPAQVALKSEIVADAFARIGRIPLAAPILVVSSPEDGYRMRARRFGPSSSARTSPPISGRCISMSCPTPAPSNLRWSASSVPPD